MNYHKPEILDHIASSYVLGTLKGAAHRRFEKMLANDPILQRSVDRWDRAFAPVMLETKAITPPKSAWKALQNRLWGAEDSALKLLGRKLMWWKAATAVATIASLALLVPFFQSSVAPPPTTLAEYVTIIKSQDETPGWLVRADKEKQQLRLERLTIADIAPDRDYELWVLGAPGANPVSLGVLPTDRLQLAVNIDAQLMASATGFAVSLEPDGGSPTGLPTGPILYQGVM